MKKFLVLFTAPTETREKMQNASSEEMQKGMQPWMDWFSKNWCFLSRTYQRTRAIASTDQQTQTGHPTRFTPC